MPRTEMERRRGERTKVHRRGRRADERAGCYANAERTGWVVWVDGYWRDGVWVGGHYRHVRGPIAHLPWGE